MSEVRWAADLKEGVGLVSALKRNSIEGGGESLAFVYSPCLMGLEVEEQYQRVSGLLQTCPSSLHMNLVVRKDVAFRRSEEDGYGN